MLFQSGMHVNRDELSYQEDLLPKKVVEAREAVRAVNPRIIAWCEQMEATDPDWVFDIEKDAILKTVLFDLMGLPVRRLTKAGKKLVGDSAAALDKLPRETLLKYAAMDKYTLSILSVDHPEVRPLQEYRKVFKEYTSYVKPMRNLFIDGVDKRRRDKQAHLMDDGCVHTSFKQTATRSGRLGSSDPNVQQLSRTSIIKRLYSSRFGDQGCMYGADLSQIELRGTAMVTGDPAMVDAYHRGIDLHSLTHSMLYGRPYEHCLKQYVEWLQKNGKDDEAKQIETERKVAKTSNFLTAYGGGPQGLQVSLAQQGVYKPVEECTRILETFFSNYSKIGRAHV